MSKPYSPLSLPSRTVASRQSEKAGREVLAIEALPVAAGDVLRLRFERYTLVRRQGIWLATVGQLEIAGRTEAQFILWADTAPSVVDISVVQTDGLLRFYNVYEFPPGSGFHRSQMNGSGMITRVVGDGRIEYACNDFGEDEAYEKVVFSVCPKDRTLSA